MPKMPTTPKNNGGMPFIAEHDGYTVKASSESGNAELTLYGNVVRKRPFDYDKKMPSDESFIVESEILSDLKKISKCKKLDIRLNSCGGECNTAIVIHNKLREMAKNGMEITCTVDGVAMSAGSHIMCAADKVRASEGSLIMIHKSMSFIFLGYFNADEFRKMALENDAYDKSIAAAYKRKTGKCEDELLKMMSDETYMTGSEALEQGFVDELIESEEKIEIAASADRSALIVGGRIMKLYGAACPDNIPIADIVPNVIVEGQTKAFAPAADGEDGDTGDANNTQNHEGGKTTMAKDLSELRKENPELAAAVEAEIKAQNANESKTAADEAVKKALEDERKRLEKIEAIAGQVSPELLADAKYKNPCTAEELAYKAMTENAKKGAGFLRDLENEYQNSEASGVRAVAPQDDAGAGLNEEEKEKEVKALIKDALGKEDK